MKNEKPHSSFFIQYSLCFFMYITCSTAPPTTMASAANCTAFMLFQPATKPMVKSIMPRKIKVIPKFLICFFIFITIFGAKVLKKFGLFKNY